jgi:hypothetical protein
MMVSMIAFMVLIVGAAFMFVCIDHYLSPRKTRRPRVSASYRSPVSVSNRVPLPPPPEDIGPDLLEHLHWVLANTPAAERKVSRWVMDPAWFLDIRKIAGATGRPIWNPSPRIEDPLILMGLPVETRPGAGPPHLEPRPEAEIALDTKEAEESLAAIEAGFTTLDEMRGGYLLPVEDLPPVPVPAQCRPAKCSWAKDCDCAKCQAVLRAFAKRRMLNNNAMRTMVLPEGAEYTPLSPGLTAQEAAVFDAITEEIRQIDDVLGSLVRSTTRTKIDLADEKNLREKRIHLMEKADTILNGPPSGVIKLSKKKLSDMTVAEYAETRKGDKYFYEYLKDSDGRIIDIVTSSYLDVRR